MTAAVFRRLLKELAELQKNPPEGIRVVTSEENMLDVTGIIEGPGMHDRSHWHMEKNFKRRVQRVPLTREATSV